MWNIKSKVQKLVHFLILPFLRCIYLCFYTTMKYNRKLNLYDHQLWNINVTVTRK